MKNFIFQPFHLVTLSPWPLYTSTTLFFLMMSMINMFNFKMFYMMYLNFIILFMILLQWWRDTIRESSFQGFHSMNTMEGLKMGMILFIISEIFFFLSFFWAYFHMFFSPSIEIGNQWPPIFMKLMLINPYNLPMLNTIILISSGMFLTMAHFSLLKKNFLITNYMMLLTIIFGLIFSIIQIFEYYNSLFTLNMSNYGSMFFMMTGFHGLHVLIGTMFIIITYMRINKIHMSNIHHLSFEMSAWYWHFVDVIWLFLFLFIYWWPF
uniref:Cytochrome c oxidase subunit 3 n=1 Tax=Habroteleia persimilis TaxID=2496286 RepID=A0A3S5HLQ2_9HYME|nr:cytochrome c oxidase subunit 3 [Habroteleia persimilis]